MFVCVVWSAQNSAQHNKGFLPCNAQRKSALRGKYGTGFKFRKSNLNIQNPMTFVCK